MSELVRTHKAEQIIFPTVLTGRPSSGWGNSLVRAKASRFWTQLLNTSQAPQFIGSEILVKLLFLSEFHFFSHKIETTIISTSWKSSESQVAEGVRARL